MQTTICVVLFGRRNQISRKYWMSQLFSGLHPPPNEGHQCKCASNETFAHLELRKLHSSTMLLPSGHYYFSAAM